MENITLMTNSNNHLSEAFLNLGFAFLDLKRNDEALKAFENAIKEDPTNSTAQNALAIAYYELGKIDDAEKSFSKAIALAPDNSRIKIRYAILLAQTNKIEGSLKLINGLEVTPDQIEMRMMLAHVLKQKKFYREALEQIHDIEKLNINDIVIKTEKADLLYRQKKYLEASEICQEILKMESSETVCLIYANILNKIGRMEDASRIIRKAIDINPNNAESWNCLSESLLKLGETNKAIDASKEALKIKPKNVSTYVTLANAFIKQNNEKRSVKVLR